MSASGSEPLAPISSVGRILDAVSAGLNAIGTGTVLGIMVLINLDVVARGLINQPIHGTIEIVRVAVVVIVYLQLSHALRADRLTRSDVIIGALRARWPAAAHLLEACIMLLGAVLLVILVATIAPQVSEAYRTQQFIGTRGVFTIPLWPVNAVITLGAGATLAQFVRLTVRHVHLAITTWGASGDVRH